MTPDPVRGGQRVAARRLKRQTDLLEAWLIGAALLVGVGVWVAALVGAGSP